MLSRGCTKKCRKRDRKETVAQELACHPLLKGAERVLLVFRPPTAAEALRALVDSVPKDEGNETGSSEDGGFSALTRRRQAASRAARGARGRAAAA